MYLKAQTSLLILAIGYVTSQSIRPSRTADFDLRPTTPAGSENDFYPNGTISAACSSCDCGRTPQCTPGVSLLTDGCNCCKMCARQLGDQCDERNVCDSHKRLYCDRKSRTCKASPGRPCVIGGKMHANGALFQLGCKATCSCINGYLGCVPTCTRTPSKTRACKHPRLLRRKGHCCEEWVCATDSMMSQYERVHHEHKAPPRIEVIFKGSCMVQTSKWSSCSRSCGFGVSDRVSNDNEDCKFKKQTRLCQIRPCDALEKAQSRKGKCRKHLRRRKRVRFSLSGCLSNDTYRPKYCGVCGDRCCKPTHARTVQIDFLCDNGTRNATSSSFSRDMMFIKKCECNESCQHSDLLSEIFSSNFGMGLGRDTWQPS